MRFEQNPRRQATSRRAVSSLGKTFAKAIDGALGELLLHPAVDGTTSLDDGLVEKFSYNSESLIHLVRGAGS